MSSEPSSQRATFEDLLALPEHVRAEIVNGELIHKASPSIEHSRSQFSIGIQLGHDFQRPAGDEPPGGWWFGTEAEVRYESSQVYLHDIAGWRRDRTPTYPTGRPTDLLPDWVCEILSPANASNDTVSKLRTLQRAEVPWYWIVDPLAGTVTAFELRDRAYSVAATGQRGERQRMPPFQAVELEVCVLLGDDPS
jgi:Uma2 family endonuclease